MPVQDPQEFFDELKEWSERKLNILEGYLDPFVKVLGSLRRVEQVYYVDAFAGKGIYQDGAKGSAIRAAELAQRYQDEHKPYRLRCINVEANQENFENLQTNTQVFRDLVTNLPGTLEDNINTILRITSGNPALFFLDPFGVKALDWQIIQRIIHRGFGTDLWIRFDYSAVIRLHGRYHSEDVGAFKSFDLLRQVYGIQDRDDLYDLLVGNTVEEKRNRAINVYLNQIAEEFQSTRKKNFAAPYIIRAITEKDKYCLIFATGHPTGATIASELLYGVEETYQREVEDYKDSKPRQLSLFSSKEPSKKEIFDDKVNRLKQTIWAKCQGQQLTRLDIYERVLPEWFGRIKSPHLTQALKELISEGKIEAYSGTPGHRKSVFLFGRDKS